MKIVVFKVPLKKNGKFKVKFSLRSLRRRNRSEKGLLMLFLRAQMIGQRTTLLTKRWKLLRSWRAKGTVAAVLKDFTENL